ncbi:transcriptional regulator [Pandoraea sp. XY-2]|nr:transcriptional regulator [Pandoraea sp. XY-2]
MPSSNPQLPTTGRGRWADIAPFVGIGREKWRQLTLAGKAPAPIRLTERCTLYDFSQVHAWIADPLNYHVKNAAQGRSAQRRLSA